MDRHAAVMVIGDRGKRLEREVQNLLRAKSVLKHMRGRCKCFFGLAAPQPEIKRDIRASTTLKMLEIGEGAGRLELFMHKRSVFGCLDLVENSREFLVFGYDQLDGLFGDMRIAGKRHRN